MGEVISKGLRKPSKNSFVLLGPPSKPQSKPASSEPAPAKDPQPESVRTHAGREKPGLF